jgi:uncharacterized membrane protein YGL010W
MTINELLAVYGASHRHPTNIRIHFVAVPVILMTLCGLIYALHPLALAAFLGASLVYYLRLSTRAFAFMLAWSAIIWAFAWVLGAWRVPACVTLFVLAWIAQFIGHKIEGKKPSFFEDLQYLWIGPLFVLVEATRVNLSNAERAQQP